MIGMDFYLCSEYANFCSFANNDIPCGFDNARLNMGAGTAAPVWLFAMNYNVLRIMSGMGGLAYSN